MINASNISLTLNSNILSDINFCIKESSIVGVIGSNGSGKSSLLRILCGTYTPTTGSVTYDDCNVNTDVLIRRKIAYISDDLLIPPFLNLRRLAAFYSRSRFDFDRNRFLEICDMLSIPKKRITAGFSKGMKKQLSIAYALSCHASYILLDETFDGLDPLSKKLCKDLIFNEMSDNGTTFFIVSHSLRELEAFCDSLLFVRDGKLTVYENIDDFKKLYSTEDDTYV